MSRQATLRLAARICLTVSVGGAAFGCATPNAVEAPSTRPGEPERLAVGRYQLVPVNPTNVMIIDTATGRVWRRFVPTNQGPTQWDEASPPFARP